MTIRSTKDLGVAAYLKTQGVEVTVKRQGNRGIFFHDIEASNLADKYYNDEEKFLSFANNMRTLKAQIENAPKEDSQCL